MVALTGTASKRDVIEIKVSLNLKNPLEVVGNPNRPKIFFKKMEAVLPSCQGGTDLKSGDPEFKSRSDH